MKNRKRKETMGALENIVEILEKAENKKDCIRKSTLQLMSEWGDLGECMEASKKALQDGLAELREAQRTVSEKSKEIDFIRKYLNGRFEEIMKKEQEFSVNQEKAFLELKLERKELEGIREKFVEEVKFKEDQLVEKAERLEGFLEKLAMGRKGLEEVKLSVEEKIKEIRLKEKDLEDQKRKHELSVSRISRRGTQLEERESELAEKEKKIENWENEVVVIVKNVGEMREKLELKEQELVKEVEFTRELSKKRVKELDSREKQLDSREEQLDSVKKFTNDCFSQFRAQKKKYQLEKEQIEKDLELKRHELEDRIQQVELREKELELKEKRYNVVIDDLEEGEIVANMDGKKLQIFFNERMKDLGSMGDEVFVVLHFSPNPAKLALDAMQGFYPPHLRKEDMEFEASVVRRTCIVILEQLAAISPNIQPCVREAAMTLAWEWKEKMTIANSLEVLGFLQLLAAYDLHSDFDPDEVMSLVESVAHDQRTTKLCHQLKFADRIPGLIQNLLRNFQCLEAVRFIYSFDKADYFPPVPILKSYLEHVEKTADASLKECNSQKAREEAIDLQVAAMGAVIRCIMDHNLESEYSTKILQERVDQLQELKMILKSRLEDNKKRPPKDDAAKSEPVKRHCGNVLLLHKHADHHPSNSLEPLPQHQSGSHTKEYSPSSKAPFRHYSLGGPAPTIQHVDQLPFHYVSNTARNRKSTHSGLPSHQIGMVSNYLPRSILPEAGNFYP